MRYHKVLAMIAVIFLTVVACGNEEPPHEPPPSTSISTPTPTSSSTPSTTSESPTTSVVTTAQGADAAPGTVSYYENSQTARTNFANWWNYEVQTAQDATLPSDKVYSAGVSVCLSRSRGVGTDAILTVLDRDMGFSGSGAAGVYKSALEALCPKFNLGYTTYFDNNVTTMIAAITPRVNFTRQMPPVHHFGFFMKEACSALEKIGGGALWNHMINLGQKPALMEQGNISEQLLRIYLKAAVNSGCSALNTQLPPVIQMAY